MKTRSPIKSAETVAALRNSFSNDSSLNYKDEYAKYFLYLGNRIISNLKPTRFRKFILNKISPGCHNFIYIRTRLIDDTLKNLVNSGVRQIIILGAGYDSRAFRFNSLLKDCKIVEFDLDKTQEYKIKQLNKRGIKIPDNVSYVPINFNQEAFDGKIQELSIQTDVPTFFIWEGVSYYLSESDVKRLLGTVSAKFKDAHILFDYTTEDFVNGDESTYGGREVQKWLKKVNEPFRFGLSPDMMEKFLNQLNLKVIFNKSPKETERKFLASVNKNERTYGHVHFILASNGK